MEASAFSQALARARAERTLGAYTALANAARKAAPGELKPLRIAVLRNFTIEPLLPAIEAEAALSGFRPELYLGDFDSIAADVFNPQSAFFQFQPDLVIVGLWLETLAPRFTQRHLGLKPAEVETEIDAVVGQARTILQRIREGSAAPVVLNNFPPTSRPTLGVLDAQLPWGQTQSLLELNRRLLQAAKAVPDAFIADYHAIFSELGFQNAFDGRYWHKGRAPLGQKALLPLAQVYGSFVRALKGLSKKCLVLDCDNTLWGGIVGEDGLQGIEIGANHPGSCFRDFQSELLNLHDRGVILALCSKNNEADVMEVLEKHPGMVLKKSHLAAWRINWDEKATNLRRLVEELNIGMDSVVFIDDSEFEIDWVKKELPAVRTLRVPEDPSRLRSVLLEEGLFDSLSLTAEDRQRSKLYGAERQRKDLETSAGTFRDYLLELGLEAEIGVPGEAEIPRVAQLTQKTNQFNLTTRRYSEGDIRRFIADPQRDVFRLRLKDRIADMGLVAVAIVKYAGQEAEIDSFLMSCRVLGRGAEDLLLAHLLNQAMKRPGTRKVRASYAATAKNQQVRDFYPKHGFTLLREGPESTDWSIDLVAPQAYPDWIRVRSPEE
jgi:FkbH-like protein